LCDAVDGYGGAWNRQDVIIFAPSPSGGAIQRVSAAGGVPADVTSRKGASVYPVFLPDGVHFLYRVAGLSVDESGVYLGSLDGKESRRALGDPSSVVFAAGRLLFIRGDTLMAQPFDGARGQTVGEVLSVAESVSFTIPSSSFAPVSVSETGVLVYQSGGWAGNNQMVWYDRGGKFLGAIGEPGPVGEPALSPNQRLLVFRRSRGSGSDLWLRDLNRGGEQRFTTAASANTAPFWSPHGDRIAFGSARDVGIANLYQKAASGSGQDELLIRTENNKALTQWSRDGQFIVYSELDLKTKRDIWVLPMDRGPEYKPIRFLRSEFDENFGQLSPDSHWMAYTSDESGRREVYVRPFPGGEFQRPISLAGGEQPRWRGDGKELFFMGGDGKMMAVMVKAVAGSKPSFEPEAPRALFGAHLAQFATIPLFEYDVTSDGKRFLLNTIASGPTSATLLNVVVNWDAGLKK
jgi:hypothetical protein